MRTAVLVFLSIFSTLGKCQSKSQATNEQKDSFVCCFSPQHVTLSLTIFASGQLVVGGYNGENGRLSSVEIFPSSDTCSIPDLPGPRDSHSLSLLSEGRLVVCGGSSTSNEKSCIVWKGGSTSWTHLYTTRSSFHIFYANKELTQQRGNDWTCGLGSNISSQLHRAARRRSLCRKVHRRDCARF